MKETFFRAKKVCLCIGNAILRNILVVKYKRTLNTQTFYQKTDFPYLCQPKIMGTDR
jgi:hypothetical protein